LRYCPNLDCPYRQLTGSQAEFLDHVERCAECGTALTTEPLPPIPPEESADVEIDWVLLAWFASVPEAQLATTWLESEGIPVWVADEYMGQMNPSHIAAMGWVKVYVPAVDLSVAQELLALPESERPEK
jgi:putative signal transducing protein